MAGRRVPLNQEQSVAMDEVKLAKAGLTNARIVAKARAKALEQEIMAQAEKVADAAIRKASDAGVSMKRIADEAMGYHNPTWVRDSLRRTSTEEGEIVTLATVRSQLFQRIPGTDRIRVKVTNFPTTSRAADYPEVLIGVVEPDITKPNGWAIIEDESATPDLPGHLQWEIERRHTNGDRHLANDIEAWAATN